MKNKYLNFFTALLLAGLFAFSVTGCSEEEEEDFATAIATYQVEDSTLGTITLAFYDDSTFKLHRHFEPEDKKSNKKIIEDYSIATGTYTGTATTDGTIKCTYKEAVADSSSISERSIFGEKKEVHGNKQYPLEKLQTEKSETYTISNGVITYKQIDGIPLNNITGNLELALKRK